MIFKINKKDGFLKIHMTCYKKYKMNLAPKNTAENLDAELLPLAKPIRRSDVLTLHVLANEHCRSILGLAFRREAPRLQKALETPEEARIPYALDASLHGEPSTLDIDLIASPRAFANRGKILRFFPCDFAAHVPQ